MTQGKSSNQDQYFFPIGQLIHDRQNGNKVKMIGSPQADDM
jgi:hypothetical protein